MSSIDRTDEFSSTIDDIDNDIAMLILRRQSLMRKMPIDYDSDGEGEIYFGMNIDDPERLYHAIAGIS